MTVTAQYAATHFDDILSAAENGEEVRIDRPDKPGIRLVVEEAPLSYAAAQTGRRILGVLKGTVMPATDEQWRAMENEEWQLVERVRSELVQDLDFRGDE
jgi:antitoxin (DNA-binding transcriptional repressor) of toxin-antitoxin stability system